MAGPRHECVICRNPYWNHKNIDHASSGRSWNRRGSKLAEAELRVCGLCRGELRMAAWLRFVKRATQQKSRVGSEPYSRRFAFTGTEVTYCPDLDGHDLYIYELCIVAALANIVKNRAARLA